MGTTSNTTGQVISLPKGGGALHGIGETFSPDLHTGTGNFTVPLALPPGRNGFQPQLSLVYSTGNGNGPFGLGWSLSVPGVSRKTSKGIPLYDDAKDTFLLSGAEDLVPVPGGPPGTIRYRPRTEGLFAHIDHHRDAKNDYWQVSSKDGLVSMYGTSETTVNDPAMVANPTDRSQIFAWKLTSTTDPFDNRIEYLYKRDAVQTDGSHHWDQNYLSEIRYADYGDPASPAFLVTVRFTYKDRPDHFSDYRAGFEMRTVQRCTRIDIFTHAGTETLTRTYHLVYLDQRNLPIGQLPRNGVSLLSQIQVEGHDGSTSEGLPPLEFGYSQFEPDKRRFSPITGAGMPPSSLANSGYELVDLFGNGLPDILEMNGTVRYWRNRGDGTFDLPHQMRDAPAGLSLADKGVQIIDANGDGRADLLVTTEAMAGYYPLRFGGLWDRRSFQRYRLAPSFDLKDPEVHLIDLDGDGVTDAVRSGNRLECFFNDPRDGWNHTRWVERQALEVFPNINFSDSRVKWADMTGDGLQDIVLVYDGCIAYWPNLGRGNWGKRVTMYQNPHLPSGYDPKRILVGDVDGDGLADMVYVDDTKVTLWINQSGNGWSNALTIEGTPPVTDMDAVRLVDLFGTGIGGVLWSTNIGGRSRTSMFFLDFTGGIKPYLLDEMNNHMGAVTRVGYAPSTRYYLKDEKQPQTGWKTPLPFPVQVVARVEVIDALSRGKLTTEYCYHHGYWDGAEREFRGFGMVEQFDSETFQDYNTAGLAGDETDFAKIEDRTWFSPPTCTRTWFHLGPVGEESGEWEEVDYHDTFWPDDPSVLSRSREMRTMLGRLPRRARRDALRTLQGSTLRTELYALDGTERRGRPYTVTEYLHSVREEEPPTDAEPDRPRIFFPHPLAQRTSQWERGDDPMTQFSFTSGYDVYGQPQHQTIVALPRRSAKRRPATGAVVGTVNVNSDMVLATHTRTQYGTPDKARYPDLYMYDRVAQNRTFELKAPPAISETHPDNVMEVIRDQAVTAQGVHAQFLALLDSWQAGQPLPDTLRLIGHTVNHYDGDAYEGRADVKQIGPYGVLTRSEILIFTDEGLEVAYHNRRPTYLGGSVDLPPNASALAVTDLGYRLETDSTSYHAGYYADIQRRKFDFQDNTATQHRGVAVGIQDALKHETTITLDDYWMLPKRVTAPMTQIVTSAVYNYRVMQPHTLTDANGHTTRFLFTPIGLLHKQWLEGREGEGGTEDRPEIEFTYQFWQYENTRFDDQPQPMFVHLRQRLQHAHEPNASEEAIESREYSDGFGRLIQKRVQAETLAFGVNGEAVGLPPTPGSAPGTALGVRVDERVVVSGWQVYENKGRVVEKYEPYFDERWRFQHEVDAKRGQHVTLYYDPRGQVIRTVNPDGSEQRVIYGIPEDLTQPDAFIPTPWEAYTYDPNDLATGSQVENGASVPVAHYFTPTTTVLNPQGKVICQVERNGSTPARDYFITRSVYDVRGNVLAVTDALGRPTFAHAYDLLNRPLMVESIDAGQHTSVLDAVGNLIECRDSKGSVVARKYDTMNRPTQVWARDNDDDWTAPMTLREQIIYGDSVPGLDALAHNLLGKVYQHYDESGLQQFDDYDFKGNITRKWRQVISDVALANGWSARWEAANAEDALDPAGIYVTESRYDALNRLTEIHLPADVDGQVAVVKPVYNRAGALEKMLVDNNEYTSHIAYNARGQRVLIAYGNQLMTRYVYDSNTCCLMRMRTEPFSVLAPASDRWLGTGAAPLQDFSYQYDLVGNITAIEANTPNCGINGSLEGRDQLIRQFTYDPLYRMTDATGRACISNGIPRQPDDQARCGSYPYPGSPPVPNQDNAPDITERYNEHYDYDPAGNLLGLIYGTSRGNWPRRFGFGNVAVGNPQPPDNRLTSMQQGNSTYSYQYDESGNLTRQAMERVYYWDHADRMVAYINQPVGAMTPSVESRYLYGADGMRVKKWVRKNGATSTVESTVYIDALFEYHRWRKNGVDGQTSTLHIMDNQSRIGLERRGTPHPDDAGPAVQYHLGDHLGSSHVVVDANRAWVNREEFTPYGETIFGGFARKRYRFSGKERDEESGLNYHGARYYALWLGRWISCDPAGMEGGLNLFTYGANNPMRLVDTSGRSPQAAPANTTNDNLAPMTVNAPAEAGQKAGQYAQDRLTKHRQAVKAHKIGTDYGSNSKYAELSDKAKAAFVKKRSKDSNTPMPEKTHCISLVNEVTAEYVHYYLIQTDPGVEHLGERLQRLQDLANYVRQSNGKLDAGDGRGTALLNYLHSTYGFETRYVSTESPDPEFVATDRAGYVPAILKGDRSFVNEIDITVPIDRYDLAKLPKQQRYPGKYNKLDFNELKKIEFAVGVTYSDDAKEGWGVHTFILSKGRVYESHWERGPTSPNVFTDRPIEKFMREWSRIVIAVPPQK